MKNAVALIIFNRPDYTARVLAEIAKVKPEKLFVIADGARDVFRGRDIVILSDGSTTRTFCYVADA
jgi:hypothetical protein